MVKIVGLSGSPRHGGTEAAVKAGLAEMEKYEGIETSLISLAGKKIAPCMACNYCKRNQCGCCIKDDMDSLLEEFLSADAYLIGSPVYVHTVTPQLLAFFSRLRPISSNHPELLRDKLGAALAIGGTRNGGEEAADLTIIQMLMAKGINIISGGTRGYVGGKLWSRDKKDITYEDDPIGMETVLDLSGKLARTALRYEKGKELVKFDE